MAMLNSYGSAASVSDSDGKGARFVQAVCPVLSAR